MSWTLPGSLKAPAEDLRASAKAEPDAHHETIDSIHPENRVHFLRAAVTHSEPGIPAKNNRSMSGSGIYRSSRIRASRVEDQAINCGEARLCGLTGRQAESISRINSRIGFESYVLSHSDGHQLLRGLPELTVDEIGGESPHQCEQIGLTRPDLDLARL